MSNNADALAVYCRVLTLALAGSGIYGALSALRKMIKFRAKLENMLQDRAFYHAGEVGVPELLYHRAEGNLQVVRDKDEEQKDDQAEAASKDMTTPVEQVAKAAMTKQGSFGRDDLFSWEKPLYDLLRDSKVVLVMSIPIGLWSLFALSKIVHKSVEQIYGHYLIEMEKDRKEKLETKYLKLLDSEVRNKLQKEAQLNLITDLIGLIRQYASGAVEAGEKAFDISKFVFFTSPVAISASLALLSFASFTPIFAHLYRKNLPYKAESAARKRLVINDLPAPRAIILHESDFKPKKTSDSLKEEEKESE